MRTIKQLDFFLLKTFLPLFIMTFGICLFIAMMQFLWRIVDDMVGKGLELHILGQLFFYAAMTFVPQVLPLAILFASLMTFGNLGEQYELLAMKASGISLVRIMRPLMVFLLFIAIAAFFFQNNVIPVSQVKMYTLLYSVRQKSMELEIPEKIFYQEIDKMNIRVEKKDKKKKLLEGVMIYDYSKGFNYMRVILADSGRLKVSSDKKWILLTLYDGVLSENFSGSSANAKDAQDEVPYRRDQFETMEILFDFDGNFDMKKEDLFQNRFVGKDIATLRSSIDSMSVRLDSIKDVESKNIYAYSYRKTLAENEAKKQFSEQKDSLAIINNMNFDSLYRVQEPNTKASLLAYSKRNIETLNMSYGTKSGVLKAEEKELRMHYTEMHKKFTLSFACLIFFFIGAPLGAIIRKGGLGTPAVISVFLFVVYYIVDNTGSKFARDGVWIPWQGMWLSSAVLLPLGVFLTYKAVNDSVILNAEIYIDTFKRLIGKREFRNIVKKDVIIEVPDYGIVEERLSRLMSGCKNYLADNNRLLNYINLWKHGGVDNEAEHIAKELDSIVEVLKNSDQNLILNKAMDFPVIKGYNLINFRISPRLGLAMAILFPLGGLVYLFAAYRNKLLRQDIGTTARVCDEIISIIEDKNQK